LLIQAILKLMNMNHKFCTKIALVLLGASPIFWNSNPAQALTLSLDNTTFTNKFTGSGYLVNNAARSSTIDDTAVATGTQLTYNTGSGGGFGNRFSNNGDTFLLLGATNTSQTINGGSGTNSNKGQSEQNTIAQSPTFTLSQFDINNDLIVSFDWAFYGTQNSSGSIVDDFKVTIENDNYSATVLPSMTNFGQGTFSGTVDLAGLQSNSNYRLLVTLNEDAGALTGNSAAGFDNIALAPTGTAVPFEFSPSLGLLLMGGLFGGHTYFKRRKLAANAKFD
jgi:hypothetical protein